MHKKQVDNRDYKDTHLDVPQFDTTTVCANTVNSRSMTFAICDWPTHNESSPRITSRVANCADLKRIGA